MIHTHIPTIATSTQPRSAIQRLGARGFWTLFAIEGIFVAIMLVVVLQILLPVRAPLAQSNDYAVVREAIWARVNGIIADPLVEIAPGVSAHASEVRGFTLNDQVYYYYFEGQPSFDPISRGAIDKRSIDVVLRDAGSTHPLVIYQLLKN